MQSRVVDFIVGIYGYNYCGELPRLRSDDKESHRRSFGSDYWLFFFFRKATMRLTVFHRAERVGYEVATGPELRFVFSSSNMWSAKKSLPRETLRVSRKGFYHQDFDTHTPFFCLCQFSQSQWYSRWYELSIATWEINSLVSSQVIGAN